MTSVEDGRCIVCQQCPMDRRIIAYSFYDFCNKTKRPNTHSDNLPHESEDEVLFAGMQIFRADVDNVAADRLSRVQRQSQVFVHLVDAQFRTAVNCSLVDGVRLR